MLRRLSFALLILASGCAGCDGVASLHAQAAAAPTWLTAPPLPGTGGEQGIIKLDVVATDKAGNPVSGLEQKDFTVLDNGQPSSILAFHGFDGSTVKANPAAEVILFLDSLRIPKKMAKFEREEVERFLRQNGGHLSRPTSVYGISESGPWRVKEPSGDGNVLADELAQGKEVRWVGLSNGGPQNMVISRNRPVNDSLGSASFLKMYPVNVALEAVSNIAVAARRRPDRKILLWIGPGCCIGSGAYLDGPSKKDDRKKIFDMVYWVSTLFREAHVTIYSFSEGEGHSVTNQDYTASLDGPKSAADASWMSVYKKVLAIQSGGRVLTPNPKLEGETYELMNQINDVVRETDIFYMLSIDASHADHPDEYHELKVEVDRPDFTARAKTGYYDQPYYVDGPNPALRRVTMEQVEAILKEDRGDRDAELAKQLSYLELTERMTSAKLRNWTMVFRGKKTRAALVALSDASAFLNPPREEVLGDAAPDASERRKMLARVSKYLSQTIPRLPNFFARRTTVEYRDIPELHEWGTETDYQPLHVARSATATVLYRNGNEVVEAKNKETKSDKPWLVTNGTFGPLLGYVSKALAVSDGMMWSRWERGDDGRRAVFHWEVPPEKSVYRVGACCLPDGDGTGPFSRIDGYFGEIAIDPVSGAILRLELKPPLQFASPPVTTPQVRADIVIEYGTAEVGGIPYVCPIRSVTISRARSVIEVKEWDQSFRTYGPYSTVLNDATFDNYHRFRSDARILMDSPPADE